MKKILGRKAGAGSSAETPGPTAAKPNLRKALEAHGFFNRRLMSAPGAAKATRQSRERKKNWGGTVTQRMRKKRRSTMVLSNRPLPTHEKAKVVAGGNAPGAVFCSDKSNKGGRRLPPVSCCGASKKVACEWAIMDLQPPNKPS